MTGFGDTIVGRPHFHSGIVVHESVEPLRPHHERRDDLPSVQLLARSGHHAALDQVHYHVGEPLGVDAQVLPVRPG